jgi:glycosyltransferase involved in cell wall biosynthesis
MEENKTYISVVVPTFNEEENVEELYKQILPIVQSYNRLFEIIFVDDGSSDNTLEELKKLEHVTIVEFRKNFGQTAALDAGIKIAQGELIVAMDADLQNDPADIPQMIKRLNEGFDVVSGWRKNRKDCFSKKFTSRVANFLRKRLINDGIHDSGCTLKVYKRKCFDKVDLYGEMHRFMPAILKLKGYKIGEIVVNHRSRVAGITKYNWKRTIKGLLDMMSIWFWKKYASRPLHLFGTIAFFLLAVGFVSGVWAVYLKLFLGNDLSDTMLTMLSMFCILIGVQFFVFGLLADVLSKNYFAATKDTPYDIKEIIRNERED